MVKRQSQNQAPVATTAELADSLGLSRWAVSRALNGRGGISVETAERVKREAERLGFRPSVFARGLRSGRSGLVGVCLPDPEDFHLAGKLGALQEGIHERGYQPLLQVSDGSVAGEVEALERFESMRCGGIVIFASRVGGSHPVMRRLSGGGTRIVRVDPVAGTGALQVSADRARASELVVGHLFRLGFRRYFLAGFHDSAAYSQRRLLGFRRAARKWGLAWENFVFPAFETHGDGLADGRRLGRCYYDLGSRRPGAVIAKNDRIAAGVMLELGRHGMRPPRDFALIGYDASELAECWEPALDTVDPRAGELVISALDLLFSEDPPAGVVRWVKPELVIRGTSGPAGKGISPVQECS